MAWQIQIQSAKPNPKGKDVAGHTPKAEQLLGEWVDLKNIGNESVTLSRLHLAHTEYTGNCVPKEQPNIYWTGLASVVLKVGETVRVHTGRSTDSWQMAAVDRNGPSHHAYAENGQFVLNNRCGDTLSVWWKDSNGNWQKEDAASYDPNPPDGAILYRQGSKLMTSTTALASRW